ncbi:hypothetical protein B0J12DRAFT_84762 [Macrophomina phaseolina]|uniref:Nephrocystin 3-like N-terminal domain-containing protein n=1 Tax=Macrophomina phaseolina TaxID=35725 RepID=A0ABQ8GCB7_9PEZI|nr:hypothetical protein B0J12DRAFT_84762 [Macrophomina phaseolina]
MTSHAAIAYRLQGVPDGYDRNNVRDLVCRLLRLDNKDVVVRSLAQHPSKEGEKVATLSFLANPTVLGHHERPTQWMFEEYDVEDGGTRIVLTLDTHFHGFTPLHGSDDDECDVDLVALSGLNGHAFGSFKAKGLNFMWIRDNLARDLQKCRLFIYGYDTNLVQSASRQTILDLGTQFAESLKTLSMSERPLILLGHSLGGLVLEQAIIDLSSPLPQIFIRRSVSLLHRIKGILLFGVPHKGMSTEALITVVQGQPNRDLIGSLNIDSPLLQLQLREFKKVRAKMRRATVVAFFETEETPTITQIAGRWQLSGPSTLLVAKTSATSVADTSIPINRNHSEMVKFPPHSEDYNRVLSQLKLIKEDKPIEQLTEEEIKALHSLGFPEQHWRRDEIEPGEDTCEWLNTNVNFRTWLRTSEDATLRRLWVRGHPGTGKSALIKYALNYLSRYHAARFIVVSFFFHSRGTPLQRTNLGFCRSILQQLLMRPSRTLRTFTQLYRERCRATRGSEIQWSEGELQVLLGRALDSTRKPLCILVDAIDEAGKSTAEELVHRFRKWTEYSVNVRILFTCRYYPPLPSICRLVISMEKENSEDISRIVGSDLSSEFNEVDAQVLEHEIIERANGMFQWATSVSKTVVDARRELGQSVHVLKEKIGQLPMDLSDLYATLLDTLTEAEKSQSVKLIRWILFAYKPLDIPALQHALVTDVDMSIRSSTQFPASPYFFDVEKAVGTLSRGLVEVREHDGRRIAQFVHQSVSDYLLHRGGLQKIDGSTEEREVIGNGHYQLARSCIRYLLLEDLQHASATLVGDPSEHPSHESHRSFEATFPLSKYARHFWLAHTIQVDMSGTDQADLLDILPWIFDEEVPDVFRMPWITLPSGRRFIPGDGTWDMPLELLRPITKPKDSTKRFFKRTYDTFQLARIHRYMWSTSNSNALRKPFNIFALAGVRSVWQALLRQAEKDHDTKSDKSTQQRAHHLGNLLFYGPKQSTKAAFMPIEEFIRRKHAFESSPLLNLLFGNPDIRPGEIPQQLMNAHVNNWFFVVPLFLAVALEHEALVLAFIKAGAEIQISSDDGDFPLSAFELGIQTENQAILHLLIDSYWKDSLVHTGQALHYAIQKKKDLMVTLLLEHCIPLYQPSVFVNVTIDDEDPLTPMEAAIESGMVSTMRILADAGANATTTCKGKPLILKYMKQRGPETVALLLNFGLDPNTGPPRWPTPLMEAVSNSDIQMVDVLLQDARTDPNLTDERGLTALMRIFDSNHRKRVNFSKSLSIFEHCARSGRFNMNMRDPYGQSLLSQAVFRGFSNIVNVLLFEGHANPNIRAASDRTPLMQSVLLGTSPVTKLLLSCENIDLEARDCWGFTALYHAMRRGNTACANLILSHPRFEFQSARSHLASLLFTAIASGRTEFLAHLADICPREVGTFLLAELRSRAEDEGKAFVVRQLDIIETSIQEEDPAITNMRRELRSFAL